jgi:hypothetical protein
MGNGLLRRGFGIGIILLFLGGCVFLSITGNGMNTDSFSDKSRVHLFENVTFVFIGQIKEPYQSDNQILFYCVRTLFLFFVDNHLLQSAFVTGGYPIRFFYDTKTGFVGNHFIVASFHGIDMYA